MGKKNGWQDAWRTARITIRAGRVHEDSTNQLIDRSRGRRGLERGSELRWTWLSSTFIVDTDAILSASVLRPFIGRPPLFRCRCRTEVFHPPHDQKKKQGKERDPDVAKRKRKTKQSDSASFSRFSFGSAVAGTHTHTHNSSIVCDDPVVFRRISTESPSLRRNRVPLDRFSFCN